MKPKEFTIKCSKWLRGEGEVDSYLLRKRDGKMCCLGFYSLACGIPEESIKGLRVPLEVSDDQMKKYSIDIDDDAILEDLIIANDDPEID